MNKAENRSDELTIKNRLGLHVRAATKLAKAAGGYQAEIQVMKNGDAADARSVLSLIGLGCDYDTKVVIEARGVDAQEAVIALSAIIADRFGEE